MILFICFSASSTCLMTLFAFSSSLEPVMLNAIPSARRLMPAVAPAKKADPNAMPPLDTKWPTPIPISASAAIDVSFKLDRSHSGILKFSFLI